MAGVSLALRGLRKVKLRLELLNDDMTLMASQRSRCLYAFSGSCVLAGSPTSNINKTEQQHADEKHQHNQQRPHYHHKSTWLALSTLVQHYLFEFVCDTCQRLRKYSIDCSGIVSNEIKSRSHCACKLGI